MTTTHTALQPLGPIIATGALAMIVVFAIASLFAAVEPQTFTTWVGFLFMCATSPQIILALLWRAEKPEAIGRMPQPLKGLSLTLITVVTGGCVALLFLYLVGGGVTPPAPMLIMYTIMSVAMTLWVVPVWHCWPLSRLSDNPYVVGIGALLLAYVLAFVLFKVFFNFAFLSESPVYVAALDPGGLFMAWSALAFFITTVGVILVCILFDFWPVQRLAGGAAQPRCGLVATLYILVLSTLVYLLFTRVLGFDPMDFMVRVPVCFVFGAFIVSNMMQHRLFASRSQPVKGLLLTGLAAVFAVLAYKLYAFAAQAFIGYAIPSASPGYELEIWIANAMLGVTFPVIIIVTGFFDFWPLKRSIREAVL